METSGVDETCGSTSGEFLEWLVITKLFISNSSSEIEY